MSAAASEPADAPLSRRPAEAVDEPIAPQPSQPVQPMNIEKAEEEPRAPPQPMVERVSPPPAGPHAAFAQQAEASAEIGHDIFAIVAESRAVLTRGVESISDEFASFARQSIDTTARTAIQMLGVKTWSDAVAVNTSFARASYDNWLDSAAKVSELGIKLAFESAKPLVNRIGKVLSGAGPSR